MNTTYLRFFTRSTDLDQPKTVFSSLQQFLPGALPDEFHVYEDEPVRFSEANLDQFGTFWWRGRFWWERKKPEVNGHLLLGTAHVHTGIFHTFESNLADDAACRDFLIHLSAQLQADFAYLHAIGDPPFSPEDREINGAGAGNLALSIPPFPWAVCFGKAYVDLLGKEALLSLPVPERKEIRPGMVYCQLTSRLLDTIENPALVTNCRDAIYHQLGKDAFCDPQNPDCKGRVPEFPKPVVVRPNPK